MYNFSYLLIYVDFLPPIFNVNCLTNGSVLLDWSTPPSGNLSSNFIDKFVKSWLFTGSCKNQQGDVYLVRSIYGIARCYSYALCKSLNFIFVTIT